MTTDQAFMKANKNLDMVIAIWEKKIKSRYKEAELLFQEAISIRDEYFSANKKMLTEELNPF